MSELDEITEDKTIEELEDLLWEYLAEGYSIGGTICSNIKDRIERLKNDKGRKTVREC